MNREAIAYLLIGLIILAMAAAIAWKIYHSRDRALGRRRGRDRARRERKSDEDGKRP
jgi:hypothetical protein